MDPQDWLPDRFRSPPIREMRLAPSFQEVARHFQGLADDRIIRRGNDGGELCRFDLCSTPLGQVHKQINCADELARGIPQRCRVGQKRHPCAVRPFGDGLHAAHGVTLLEGHGHRALVMREQSTVRPKQTPRSAPLIGSDLGTVSPQIFSGLIVIGDAALRVSSVNSNRQCIQNFSAGCHRLPGFGIPPLGRLG